jgi:hypothetical protein
VNIDRVQLSFYDDFGRLERLEDPDGQTHWIYDGTGENEIGRVVETVSPTGQQTFYNYQRREAGRNRGLLHKLRSQDGRWQYRAKPRDVFDYHPHIHLEHLNPVTGEVLRSFHLLWPGS